uniref:FH2 domain-containing protein n=1 Tax=Ascaris lumbricoides TaxID=6252 RepID=A0A0M3HZJ1_ASCLU
MNTGQKPRPAKATKRKSRDLLKTLDAMDSAVAKIKRTWSRDIFKFSQHLATANANMFYVVEKFVEAREKKCQEVEASFAGRADHLNERVNIQNKPPSTDDGSEVDIFNDKDTTDSVQVKQQMK